MTCRYCGREHDARVLCRGVSRRGFFFFGAAAAVATVAPVLAESTTQLVLGKNVWGASTSTPAVTSFSLSTAVRGTFDGDGFWMPPLSGVPIVISPPGSGNKPGGGPLGVCVGAFASERR